MKTLRRWRVRWLEWRRARQGTVIVCPACRYAAISSDVYAMWFARRFVRETRTIWLICPRCEYRWDTRKGPPA